MVRGNLLGKVFFFFFLLIMDEGPPPSKELSLIKARLIVVSSDSARRGPSEASGKGAERMVAAGDSSLSRTLSLARRLVGTATSLEPRGSLCA